MDILTQNGGGKLLLLTKKYSGVYIILVVKQTDNGYAVF